MRRGPFDRLAIAASLVFIADFATKQWALRVLDGSDHWLGGGWHLTIINNTYLAGGLQNGGFELPFTAILTLIVALLVLRICRQLAAIDAAAPTTLGLLLGAGAANLADALLPPSGVVDFIAFTGSAGRTTSFNIADVVLGVGLILCLRTIWRITQTMRGRLFSREPARQTQMQGVLHMRDRVLVSASHALLAMCAFLWLYSMAIAFTPDAGRSAPNSLLCGVGVFAIAFLTSQARLRLADRRSIASLRSSRATQIEHVVLDGSIPMAPLTDLSIDRSQPAPRVDIGPSTRRAARPSAELPND